MWIRVHTYTNIISAFIKNRLKDTDTLMSGFCCELQLSFFFSSLKTIGCAKERIAQEWNE